MSFVHRCWPCEFVSLQHHLGQWDTGYWAVLSKITIHALNGFRLKALPAAASGRPDVHPSQTYPFQSHSEPCFVASARPVTEPFAGSIVVVWGQTTVKPWRPRWSLPLIIMAPPDSGTNRRHRLHFQFRVPAIHSVQHSWHHFLDGVLWWERASYQKNRIYEWHWSLHYPCFWLTALAHS